MSERDMLCIDCEERSVFARQLCQRCYLLHYRAGLGFPPIRRITSAALPSERWKDCSLSSDYEVSDFGRVRPAERDIILESRWGRSGYRVVRLQLGRKQLTVGIHRLVLEAFVGPRPQSLVACHYDDDRLNNYLTNLRWDTRASNYADAVRNGRFIARR